MALARLNPHIVELVEWYPSLPIDWKDRPVQLVTNSENANWYEPVYREDMSITYQALNLREIAGGIDRYWKDVKDDAHDPILVLQQNLPDKSVNTQAKQSQWRSYLNKRYYDPKLVDDSAWFKKK